MSYPNNNNNWGGPNGANVAEFNGTQSNNYSGNSSAQKNPF